MVALRERAARQRTQEDVEGIVRQFVEGDVSRLVPEVGMNVVGATPYAEEPGETAAVEGELPRTPSGINPNRGCDSAHRATSLAFVVGPRVRPIGSVRCQLSVRRRD